MFHLWCAGVTPNRASADRFENMKQTQQSRRRGRGRSNARSGSNSNSNSGNNGNRGQSGNRSGTKNRGNVKQQLEKYKNMARDATQNGDHVTAEYHLQHVDHFQRLLNEMGSDQVQSKRQEQSKQQGQQGQQQEQKSGNPGNVSADAVGGDVAGAADTAGAEAQAAAEAGNAIDQADSSDASGIAPEGRPENSPKKPRAKRARKPRAKAGAAAEVNGNVAVEEVTDGQDVAKVSDDNSSDANPDSGACLEDILAR